MQKTPSVIPHFTACEPRTRTNSDNLDCIVTQVVTIDVLGCPRHLPPKEATRLLASPKEATISYRASPMRPKRRPVHGLEQRIAFGKEVETIKLFRFNYRQRINAIHNAMPR
jgi:hypothetical protein